jgi:hypothetical protein
MELVHSFVSGAVMALGGITVNLLFAKSRGRRAKAVRKARRKKAAARRLRS